MSFWHAMSWKTQGIRATAPVKWHRWEGLVGVVWEAEAEEGASGYYLADDPWIMIFLDDVSDTFRITNDDPAVGSVWRPLANAIYVPPGMPLWTKSLAGQRFSHLNLHLRTDRLSRFLGPAIAPSMAQLAVRRPVEVHDDPAIRLLAGLLADEIREPTKHPVFAESLVRSLICGLVEIPAERAARSSSRLTQAQMNKLIHRFSEIPDGRLSVAEMAKTVGLSESWFATVFMQTTGQSPLQWQLASRIGRAKQLLSDTSLPVAAIAALLGFADQAHLTKVFRQITKETPAAWRATHQASRT